VGGGGGGGGGGGIKIWQGEKMDTHGLVNGVAIVSESA